MTDLRQEHGRLIAKLRRQVDKAQRLGVTDDRARKVRGTVVSLIVTEKLLDMDPLHVTVVRGSARRLDVLAGTVTDDDIRVRLGKLTPGAGLVIAR